MHERYVRHIRLPLLNSAENTNGWSLSNPWVLVYFTIRTNGRSLWHAPGQARRALRKCDTTFLGSSPVRPTGRLKPPGQPEPFRSAGRIGRSVGGPATGPSSQNQSAPGDQPVLLQSLRIYAALTLCRNCPTCAFKSLDKMDSCPEASCIPSAAARLSTIASDNVPMFAAMSCELS